MEARSSCYNKKCSIRGAGGIKGQPQICICVTFTHVIKMGPLENSGLLQYLVYVFPIKLVLLYSKLILKKYIYIFGLYLNFKNIYFLLTFLLIFTINLITCLFHLIFQNFKKYLNILKMQLFWKKGEIVE